MASRAVDRTLADFIAGALSPPLIMALVGSLVFFLQEILYEGLYHGTLQWVLFFFVFGAVLVARMSMQQGFEGKSAAYGLLLGGLTWMALRLYVDYSENPILAGRSGFINLGLIALIWWSAHRLTLDCTYMSEEATGQGTGLLDAAGLGKPVSQDASAEPQENPAKTKKSKKKRPEEKPGFEGWWARFLRYREQRKKQPKTLGVWVVFFSLAALPLFGLGQAQIPPDSLDRRAYAFTLLLIYVGAGLGLLLTTSFLSLRMYLRERGITMPWGITVGWLCLGGLLIAGHLFVSSLLPRPSDPQPLWDWTGLTRAEVKDPSRLQVIREKDDLKKRQGPAQRKHGKSSTKRKSDKDQGGKADPNTRSEDKQTSNSGKAKGSDKTRDGEQGEKSDDGRDKNDKDGEDNEDKGDDPARAGEDSPDFKMPDALTPLSPLLEFMLQLARWLIIAMVVVVIAVVLGRNLLQFLANFTLWAKRLLGLLDKLFEKKATGGEKSEQDKPAPTPRPFASYSNPFSSGRARQMSPAELVRYSFAGLQAWGREHNLPRAEGETPMEFALRIGERHTDLGEQSRKLALLYARLAYSTDTLSEVKIERLRPFWQCMVSSGQSSVASGQ